MIYLDTSALVKLVFEESESNALEQWLAYRADIPMISSELSSIELLRTCGRRDRDAVSEARRLLAGIDLLPMVGDIVERAANVGPADLRSLDAIYLASALLVKTDLMVFVVYDDRLRSAAVASGFEVASPA